MSEVQHDVEKPMSVVRNNPAVTAYLFIVFATPFSSGSPWHVLYALCWFLLFIVYVFFHTQKYKFSLLKQLKENHPVIFYLLLAFTLSSVVSYLLVIFGEVSAEQKVYSTIRCILYLIITAYVFSLARFCRVNNLDHSRIFLAYMLGTIVLVGLLLLIYFLGDAPNAAGWAIEPPLGEHVRLMGMTASVSLMVSVIFLVLKNNNSRSFQIVLLLCMLICSAFLIWTGSRASMLLSVLTIFLVIGIGRLCGVVKLHKVASIVICIGLSIWVAGKFSIYEWNGIQRAVSVSIINDPQISLQGQQFTADVSDKLMSGRIRMWTITWAAIQQAPWFGLGPYGYFFIPDRPNIYDHPHNFILQFLVEWGGIGAFMLLAMLVYFAWHGLKNLPQAFKARDIDYVIPAAIVFIMTLTGLVDGAYFLSQPLFCMTTAFAVFPFFTGRERDYFKKNIDSMKRLNS